MPSYTLLPGTNQLIYNYPGRGSQLFGQFGYDIPQPTWRDYRNMLQTDRGLEFAAALANLLTKIWPSGPHATGTPATAAPSKPAPVATKTSTSSLFSLPIFQTPQIESADTALTKSINAAARSTSYMGQYGQGNWAGPDPVTFLHAYHELVNHVDWMDWRHRNPRYFVTNEFLLPNQSFEVVNVPYALNPGGGGLPQQPGMAADAPVKESWFAAHKKLIIIGAALVAIAVLYFKIIKK